MLYQYQIANQGDISPVAKFAEQSGEVQEPQLFKYQRSAGFLQTESNPHMLSE